MIKISWICHRQLNKNPTTAVRSLPCEEAIPVGVVREWSAGLFSRSDTTASANAGRREGRWDRERCWAWDEKHPSLVSISSSFQGRNRPQAVYIVVYYTCSILGAAYISQVVRKRSDQGWCHVDRAHQVNEWSIRILTRLEPAHSLGTLGFLHSGR